MNHPIRKGKSNTAYETLKRIMRNENKRTRLLVGQGIKIGYA